MNQITKFSIFLATILVVFSAASFVYGCNSHAYKECVGDSIHWYDSCSNVQDLYQNCSEYNLTCQYGQCVANIINNNYVAHSQISCYGENLYWFDSLGTVNSLYRSCSDKNECTIDNCKSAKCINALKCDGSTCAPESDDFKKYCSSINCGNGECDKELGETEDTCSSDCKTEADNPIEIEGVSISFFTKKEVSSQQWDKSVQVGQNGTVYFMITINNSSDSQIDDVFVSVNIPSEISYLGNLTVDGVALSGDIVSGVDIGSVQPVSKKTITFEGKTQTFSIQESKDAVAFISSVEPHQSDSISINFDANQSGSAAISSVPMQEQIRIFLKRWYMWIIAGLVMIFLFVIVFKRISSAI